MQIFVACMETLHVLKEHRNPLKIAINRMIISRSCSCLLSRQDDVLDVVVGLVVGAWERTAGFSLSIKTATASYPLDDEVFQRCKGNLLESTRTRP